MRRTILPNPKKKATKKPHIQCGLKTAYFAAMLFFIPGHVNLTVQTEFTFGKRNTSTLLLAKYLRVKYRIVIQYGTPTAGGKKR